MKRESLYIKTDKINWKATKQIVIEHVGYDKRVAYRRMKTFKQKLLDFEKRFNY